MSTGRLTRRELGWLLAEEARGAASALRQGVRALTSEPPSAQATLPPVEGSLDALEDAIAMLSGLEDQSPPKRYGRIDLAALAYEVAPGARIAIEPGAGTEVFGEERELRRLMNLLVGQSPSELRADLASPELRIQRQGDFVRISVQLGPDTAAMLELERRWLGRMALRLGGRFELERGMQVVYLPADGSTEQREVLELRQELADAQELGRVYAKELASAFSQHRAPVADERHRATTELGAIQEFAGAFLGIVQRWARQADDPNVEALSVSWGPPPLELQLRELASLTLDAPNELLDISAVVNAELERARRRLGPLPLALHLGTKPVLVSGPAEGLQLLVRYSLRCVLESSHVDSTLEARLEPVEGGSLLTFSDGNPNARAFGSAAGPELSAVEGITTLMAAKLAAWLEVAFACVRKGSGIRLTLRFPGPARATS